MTRAVPKLSPDDLVEELRSLESVRGMSAQEFYDRFRAGELGDDPDTLHWAGLCYMAVRRGVLERATPRA